MYEDKQILRKKNFYMIFYRLILTFSCVSWILTVRKKSKVHATEMKHLRRVKGVKIVRKVMLIGKSEK